MKKTDGMILGNGRCYFVEGMPYALDRTAKTSDIETEKVPLHYIAEINGPVYGFNNFAYGFTAEFSYQKGENFYTCCCTDDTPQTITSHSGALVNTFAFDDLAVEITDAFAPKPDAIVRRIAVENRGGLALENLTVTIRYYYDKRNLTYLDFDGSPLPMPKSVKHPLLYQDHVQAEKNTVTFQIPACKPMYDDWACGYGAQLDYAYMQKRFLQVAAYPAAATADGECFSIPLGNLPENGTATAGLVFAFAYTRQEVGALTASLSREGLSPCQSAPKNTASYRVDSDNKNIPKLLENIETLIRSATAEQGGVLAQPVMYPMAYNRDMYGSAVFYYGTGAQKRLKKLIEFLFVCQSKYKLQNAYDVESFSYQPPADFSPVASRHELAEVPSYLVLMARDYYRMTDDLAFMAEIFAQLCYNIDHQQVSAFFTVSTQGDESYTNFAQSTPKYPEEMTDSCFLYVIAAEFAAEIAEKLSKADLHEKYSQLAAQARQALETRMWSEEKQHYIFSRNESDIDDRPAFDLLCHPLFFRYCDMQNAHGVKSAEAVLEQLTEPYFQVVPGFNTCAGGDIGYLLFNLARLQHPLANDYFNKLEEFVSPSGTFAEYYFHRDGAYVRKGGNLRPWESGINGYAVFHYLFGIEPNLQDNTLVLRPHLPDDTQHVSLTDYAVGEEKLSLSIAKMPSGKRVSVALSAKTRALRLRLFLGAQPDEQFIILFDGVERQALRQELPTACQSSEYLLEFTADGRNHQIDFILK